jgi:prepilin signal peptidase PulO-like enzyme (type II secretory pathway)
VRIKRASESRLFFFVDYNARMLLVCISGGLLAALTINYLADVLPVTRRLSKPLWMGAGRFPAYLKRIRVQIVFILGAIAGAALCVYPPPDMHVLLLAYVVFYFGLVAVIDIEHRIVMHPVSIAGAITLAGVGLTRHDLFNTLLGGVAGFLFMLVIYFVGDLLGRLLSKMRGQAWEETALGFGDVNLAGVIGLLMGWPGVIAALFVGMLAASMFSAAYLLISFARGTYKPFASIPYAPFLCFGAVLIVLVGVYI